MKSGREHFCGSKSEDPCRMKLIVQREIPVASGCIHEFEFRRLRLPNEEL